MSRYFPPTHLSGDSTRLTGSAPPKDGRAGRTSAALVPKTVCFRRQDRNRSSPSGFSMVLDRSNLV